MTVSSEAAGGADSSVIDAVPEPLGALTPRPYRPSWQRRAIDNLTGYLPLLVMAALALGTWWLVKNTPLFETDRPSVAARHEADYTMTQFIVQRFSADGQLRVQIEGDAMRHYPDTDTIEVDRPRIRAYSDSADRRVTTATANHALSNRDGSEVQLSGDAHVVREANATQAAIDFRGEFLHCFQFNEQVRSHLPVVVTQAGTEIHADSMAYDNLTRLLDLKGHLRAVLSPPARGAR